jgi:hypothetical protein
MAVLAAIGLGVQALSGVGSFIQAGQRQKEIDKANRAAQKAVAEAKKQIQVKPYEALTVSDTPYERQREQFASQAAQATQAAAEMGAAGMGRVGAIAMAGDEAQAKVRDQQIKQLETIEQLKAQDEARASQQMASISLQEAEGAQKAAADAQAAKAASITSGMGSLTSIGQQMGAVNPYTGEAMFELYGKDKSGGAGTQGGTRGADASTNAITQFGRGTQGSRDLSMALITGKPYSGSQYTTLTGDYSNPLAYENPLFSLTGTK